MKIYRNEKKELVIELCFLSLKSYHYTPVTISLRVVCDGFLGIFKQFK